MFPVATFCNLINNSHLAHVIDTANKLLELVVDGPEIEMVWNAFQVDSDSKATKADVREEMDDDEEREARLLHPNVDMEG